MRASVLVDDAQPAALPDAGSWDPGLDLVRGRLDPVLTPLGSASGQAGVADGGGQVIFCRGLVDSVDGARVDLVVDLDAAPRWRVADVRYWGFPVDRWHLELDRDAALLDQLVALVESLPRQLTAPPGQEVRT